MGAVKGEKTAPIMPKTEKGEKTVLRRRASCAENTKNPLHDGALGA